MPRRPTSNDAVGAARFFLEGFIERTDSQDHILPKNDTFSPFCGFCRVFPEVPCPSPLLRSAVLQFSAATADACEATPVFEKERWRVSNRRRVACCLQQDLPGVL